MSKSAFIDTSVLVALYDKTGEHHSASLAMMDMVRRERIRLVLSDYILNEAVYSRSDEDRS